MTEVSLTETEGVQVCEGSELTKDDFPSPTRYSSHFERTHGEPEQTDRENKLNELTQGTT